MDAINLPISPPSARSSSIRAARSPGDSSLPPSCPPGGTGGDSLQLTPPPPPPPPGSPPPQNSVTKDVQIDIVADTVDRAREMKECPVQDFQALIEMLKQSPDWQPDQVFDQLQNLQLRFAERKLKTMEVPIEPRLTSEKVLHGTGSVLKEVGLLMGLLPGLVLLADLVIGCVLALVEDWDWKTGFDYMVSVTCGLATPLGKANNVSPTTNVGMIMTGLSGLWVLGVTGMIGGWASKTKTVKALIHVFHSCLESDWQSKAGTALNRVAAITIAVFVLYPLALGLFVLCCGCLLAKVEQWKWFNGGYYLFANVAGLPNPLVPNSPTSGFGILFDTIVSAWCYVFAAVLVGIASNLPLPKPKSMAKYGASKCSPSKCCVAPV